MTGKVIGLPAHVSVAGDGDGLLNRYDRAPATAIGIKSK
jgi:hypothetical protein